MVDPKVHLIIACWLGNRRIPDPFYIEDLLAYLKMQVKALTHLDHNLTRITFALNQQHPPSNSFGAIEFNLLNFIPTHIRDADVMKMSQPNRGMSYGLYNLAYTESQDDNYDYYIFLEDDVVFTRNNFDRELIDLHQKMKSPGFMCGYVEPVQDYASVCWGIADKEALKRVYKEYRGLPHAIDLKDANDYSVNEVLGQIDFGVSFLHTGSKLCDFVHYYNIPIMTIDENPRWINGHDPKKPTMFMPCQIIQELDFEAVRRSCLSGKERIKLGC